MDQIFVCFYCDHLFGFEQVYQNFQSALDLDQMHNLYSFLINQFHLELMINFEQFQLDSERKI